MRKFCFVCNKKVNINYTGGAELYELTACRDHVENLYQYKKYCLYCNQVCELMKSAYVNWFECKNHKDIKVIYKTYNRDYLHSQLHYINIMNNNISIITMCLSDGDSSISCFKSFEDILLNNYFLFENHPDKFYGNKMKEFYDMLSIFN